ncbi:MAG: nucleotidyl transferase AbiEii/AbiGii toxin family protein [Oscillospiraceae bacterium]|nr:nucleotidyl transferase AbiEii/AbiGii toxin family protein [Oscillospiraceae bacterium]
MKLHLDKNAFRVLLDQIHERTGYRTDVLEKDYYVVLMLHELAEKQMSGLRAYFKGGTALYKALKTTNRFSEDIDLSVDTQGCSRSQNDRRLEQATKRYDALERDVSAGITNRSEVVSVYTYTPITSYDANDALQRFGIVKIEATSFTISEPTEELEIAPLIYDLATETEQLILSEQYDVNPFKVVTITIERIFIDKLFAAEAYARRSEDNKKAFEAAKHIYDLSVMIKQPCIQDLLENEITLKRLLDIRIKEELGRLDGIPGVLPADFILFDSAINNNAIKRAYEVMQTQYVLKAEDRIEYSAAMSSLDEIHEMLINNMAWVYYQPSEELVSVLRQKEAHYTDSKHEKNREVEDLDL